MSNMFLYNEAADDLVLAECIRDHFEQRSSEWIDRARRRVRFYAERLGLEITSSPAPILPPGQINPWRSNTLPRFFGPVQNF